MKKLLIIMALVITLAVPFTAFAATSDTLATQAIRGFCGIDTSKFTDQQKADLNEQSKKIMEIKKETINKMVTNGALTEDQGVPEIERIDGMLTYHQDNGVTGACGTSRSSMSKGCSGSHDSNTSHGNHGSHTSSTN